MPEHTLPRGAPDSASREREYLAAYDALAARWPAGTATYDLPSVYGSTRVTAAGDSAAPPLVLLHGGDDTGLPWYPVAAALAAGHRVYAVDRIGAGGRSVPDGRPLRTREDLMSWLETVLDGLGVARADLGGHSYGGWLALSFALRSPARVRRLALLDPTDCFAGLAPLYRARAVPLLLHPTPRRRLRFLRWETRGRALDEGYLALATAEHPADRIIFPRRPDPAALRTLDTPTLVLLAARSRAHDVRAVARRAGALLPHATVVTLPGASHHSVPLHDADALVDALAAFLG